MKIKTNSDEQEYFRQLLDSIPEEVKQAISISMAIASQINFILKKNNISQREFANRLGKKESEISKWLSGNHNFTTNTIGKIQSVLGEDVIQVPIYAKKEVKFIPVQNYTQSLQSPEFSQKKSEPVFIQTEFQNLTMILNCDMDCHATEFFN